MTKLALGAAWRARVAVALNAPPSRPREALWWQGERIGSVEPDLFERAGLAGRLAHDARGWHVGPGGKPGSGALSEALAQLADGLRAARLAHVWRNELLAVRNGDGVMLGAIERAAVRPLGIATVAVHLLALDPQGRHWVQQRAWDKDSDPGLWDTLVGGMVPAGEPLREALARESWEEAGLLPGQLQQLRHGGTVRTERPCADKLPHGYVVQDIEWFTCVLPEGVVPQNQDGEVAAFDCLAAAEVEQRLASDEFTLDAAALFAVAFT